MLLFLFFLWDGVGNIQQSHFTTGQSTDASSVQSFAEHNYLSYLLDVTFF